MASLKDIRVRIGSVKTTRQVTSAMKMVSAAKFKKAHDQIIAFRPYVTKLESILVNLVGGIEEDFSSPYSKERFCKKALIVVITSNRGLCGAFNSNVAKLAERTIQSEFQLQLSMGEVDIIAVGKQGAKLLRSHGYNVTEEMNELYSHCDYASSANLAQKLMNMFTDGTYDKIVLVYNEFINAAMQEPSVKQFLPIEFPKRTNKQGDIDYLFEPNKVEIINGIVPKTLKAEFYGCILESVAAEHGARMTSMHKATDNATELIHELQLAYNKARQTSITNEILEIVGGAEALSK